MKNPPQGYTRVCPYLLYEDASGAIEYLTTTFGFVQRMTQTGGAGRMHTELVLGEDGLVMLGQAGESFKSPKRLDAYPPVLIHFYVDDVDALHERARAAGADVTDLETAPVGDRRFTATDPEGRCGCSHSGSSDIPALNVILARWWRPVSDADSGGGG